MTMKGFKFSNKRVRRHYTAPPILIRVYLWSKDEPEGRTSTKRNFPRDSNNLTIIACLPPNLQNLIPRPGEVHQAGEGVQNKYPAPPQPVCTFHRIRLRLVYRRQQRVTSSAQLSRCLPPLMTNWIYLESLLLI